MTNNTETSSRTEHLLALTTKGDHLFNARDWQALGDVHHPDMIAYIPGSAEPIYDREAHGAAMQQLSGCFPTSACTPRTRSSLEATTGSPWSPTPGGRSPWR
jgi:hypothetical protein